jgi:hypothetical protein
MAVKVAALKSLGVTVPQYTAMFHLAEVPQLNWHGQDACDLGIGVLIAPTDPVPRQGPTVSLRRDSGCDGGVVSG